MFDGRVVVAGEQLSDGSIPDQPPSPADPVGDVVDFAGGLGHITQVQQRPDFHQRQLDRLGYVETVRVEQTVAGSAQRVQRLHRLGEHRCLQDRRGDVGRIDQRYRQRGHDLPGGQLLRMHLAVQVHVGVRDQQVHSECRTAWAEDRRQPGPRHPGVLGDYLAQNPHQLGGHLLGGGEPAPWVRVSGAAQQPGERVVGHQDRVVFGQPVYVAAIVGAQVQGERRERASHGVDVGGHRGAGPYDLWRLEAGCPIQVAE